MSAATNLQKKINSYILIHRLRIFIEDNNLGYVTNSAYQSSNMKCTLSLHQKSSWDTPAPVTFASLAACCIVWSDNI